MTRTWFILPAVSALLAVACGGCQHSHQFSRENFDTVYIKEPAPSVERKLGPPNERNEDRWIYINPAPYYRAEIDFKDNKVYDKKWSYERDRDDDRDRSGKTPKRSKIR